MKKQDVIRMSLLLGRYVSVQTFENDPARLTCKIVGITRKKFKVKNEVTGKSGWYRIENCRLLEYGEQNFDERKTYSANIADNIAMKPLGEPDKTVAVLFKMTAVNNYDLVTFSYPQTQKSVEDYFEEKCGGVYFFRFAGVLDVVQYFQDREARLYPQTKSIAESALKAAESDTPIPESYPSLIVVHGKDSNATEVAHEIVLGRTWIGVIPSDISKVAKTLSDSNSETKYLLVHSFMYKHYTNLMAAFFIKNRPKIIICVEDIDAWHQLWGTFNMNPLVKFINADATEAGRSSNV